MSHKSDQLDLDLGPIYESSAASLNGGFPVADTPFQCLDLLFQQYVRSNFMDSRNRLDHGLSPHAYEVSDTYILARTLGGPRCTTSTTATSLRNTQLCVITFLAKIQGDFTFQVNNSQTMLQVSILHSRCSDH